eukprot:12494260-Alexandrium_andersonii.AAC.1
MLCNWGLGPQFPSDSGISGPRSPNGRPSVRAEAPSGRPVFGGPRGPKHLHQIRRSLTFQFSLACLESGRTVAQNTSVGNQGDHA